MRNGFKNKFKITGELFVNTEYKCLCGNEKVKIQDPKNNLIQEISLEELYLLEQELARKMIYQYINILQCMIYLKMVQQP